MATRRLPNIPPAQLAGATRPERAQAFSARAAVQAPSASAAPAAPQPGPPTKRAPGSVYRMPPAQGPGAENVRAAQARLRELPPTIAFYRAALPAVATAQGVCIPLLDRLARMQLNLVATVQQLDRQNRQQSASIAIAAARESLRDGMFASVADRGRAEEARASQLITSALAEAADKAAAEREDEATALVNKSRDALIAARESIVRAEFEHDLDVSAESDPEFLRRVEALRTKVASMPVFRRSPFALELYRRALDLADDGRQRLIEAALLPMATEQVLEGAAKLRAADSRAGRAGDATKALNAAVLFTNKAIERQKFRDGSEEIAAARAVQGQLELVFLKTGGIDPVDPASVSGAQFQSWMSGGKPPASLTADLPIDPRWLTRPLRSKSAIKMPPYQGPGVPVRVRGGAA